MSDKGTGGAPGQDESVNLHPTATQEPEVVDDNAANAAETNAQATEGALAPQSQGGALAVADDNLDDGWEELDSTDGVIPFLQLLQDNSPARKKKHEKYVEGAEEGMILNTATQDLYGGDNGMMFLPVHVQKVVVEWSPRNEDGSGGGFVGRTPGWDHPDIVRCKAQGLGPKDWKSSAGNNLKQTYYVWGIIIDPENPDALDNFAILSMESTKLSVFQQFNQRSKKVTEPVEGGGKRRVPLYRILTRIGSKFVQKDPSYYNYTMDWAHAESGEVTNNLRDAILAEDDPRVQAALSFRTDIGSGKVTSDDASQGGGEGGGDGESDPF